MQIFDHIDPTDLERRQLHLWFLTFTTVVVLAVGTALLMYPSVFSTPVVVSGQTQRQAFFGFCALAFLLLGYLVDRQLTITRLRRDLTHQKEEIVRVRSEASADLLGTLPDFSHFQDRLVMEYRRAVSIQQPLSLVMTVLKAPDYLPHSMEASTAYGDAAKALMRKLRGEDSIYLFSPGVFCIVLPGVTAANAYNVSSRLTEGLQDASGASSRFSFRIQVFNYPEHAKSARQLEEAVRPFIPKDLPGARPEALETASTQGSS